jgi:hypothetical protein
MICVIQVIRLQEQLQTERELRATLELGLGMQSAHSQMPGTFDSKVVIFKRGILDKRENVIC